MIVSSVRQFVANPDKASLDNVLVQSYRPSPKASQHRTANTDTVPPATQATDRRIDNVPAWRSRSDLRRPHTSPRVCQSERAREPVPQNPGRDRLRPPAAPAHRRLPAG